MIQKCALETGTCNVLTINFAIHVLYMFYHCQSVSKWLFLLQYIYMTSRGRFTGFLRLRFLLVWVFVFWLSIFL